MLALAARDLRLQLVHLDRWRQLPEAEERLQRQFVGRLRLPVQRSRPMAPRRAAASSTARSCPATNWHSAGCALQSAGGQRRAPWRPRRRPNPDGRSCDRPRPARHGFRAGSATASALRCRRRMRCDTAAAARACRRPAPRRRAKCGLAFCSRSNALAGQSPDSSCRGRTRRADRSGRHWRARDTAPPPASKRPASSSAPASMPRASRFFGSAATTFSSGAMACCGWFSASRACAQRQQRGHEVRLGLQHRFEMRDRLALVPRHVLRERRDSAAARCCPACALTSPLIDRDGLLETARRPSVPWRAAPRAPDRPICAPESRSQIKKGEPQCGPPYPRSHSVAYHWKRKPNRIWRSPERAADTHEVGSARDIGARHAAEVRRVREVEELAAELQLAASP